MGQVIVFQNETGGVAVCSPSDEDVAIYGIVAIAQKDVPHGKPYQIMDAADLPQDETFFDAWEIDPSKLTSGIGSPSDQYPPELVAAVNAAVSDESPIIVPDGTDASAATTQAAGG